jgi:hypothetical protein
VTEQQVHERGLARARRAHERARGARLDELEHLVDPQPVDAARRDHRHVGRRRLDDLGDLAQELGAIGLGEDDHRLRAAVPCEHEKAFESPRRQRTVEPVHERDHVDVRHEHLIDDLLGRVASRERVPPGQYAHDDHLVVGARLDHDPVARGRGDRALRARGVGDRTHETVAGDHVALATIDARDAAAARRVTGRRGPLVVPAVRLEIDQRPSICL